MITSHPCGTLGYLAPELYSGVITLKLDIYSLGVIFTEILIGQKEPSPVDDVRKHI
ncbi:hypothetical protein BAE44_0008340 [Dichanthelium oligosanthes]|uniref:Protein kinase domain-containing protein n=1 Tax=Dichanthelium oligosanthes TaxID=888268 RepID=A0A1E5W000_9POAL|nr:hypothetical protein BAE44_0008340 [Dichanthelium oligosanthes]